MNNLAVYCISLSLVGFLFGRVQGNKMFTKVGESENPSHFDVDDEFDYDSSVVSKMISELDELIALFFKNYYNFFFSTELLNINRDKRTARNINVREVPINVTYKTPADIMGHTNVKILMNSTTMSTAIVATKPLTNNIQNKQNVTYAIKSYNVLHFFPFLSNNTTIRNNSKEILNNIFNNIYNSISTCSPYTTIKKHIYVISLIGVSVLLLMYFGVLLFTANYRARLFRNFRRGINQQEENILLHML